MKRLLACLAAVAWAGSQYDPYAHLYTTRKPSQQDVIGRYRLTERRVTAGRLSALSGKVSTVELLADGRFVAVNVPPWQTGEPDAHFFEHLVSGSGTWRIDSVGGVYKGGGREQTRWGVYLDSPAARIEPLGFTGSKPPYGLIFTIGDPDLGQAKLFERQR